MSNDSYKETLLRESIQDTQATIRALDVKAGFLFVFLCVPFGTMDKITPAFTTLIKSNNLFILLILSFFVLWGYALVILFSSIAPQNNPKDSIDFNGITNQPKGFLFGGYHLQKLGFFQLFQAEATPKEKIKLLDEINFIKNLSEEAYLEELNVERGKLITIRNLKTQRLNVCIKTIFIWLILSASLWVIYLIVS
ncbi:hypothetical protein ACUTA3_18390 [Acinetobacter baumannii]|nr:MULTISPECIES: hypothetical protein [Acinetobacter]AYX98577.1 hypothetical protein EGY13_19495 [Acinetobacter sp. FDAARGOS_493]EHU1230667.1 hypothetical protein [Acinetobacter baumannii]EHU1234648.1 hypothetical protein [Acinetobacter baumannii]EHU1246941.1 hypothetical protein [Acinetobacter baumannii]EHU1296301.1 hypothetical protein [Acinetobacter baumannii]